MVSHCGAPVAPASDEHNSIMHLHSGRRIASQPGSVHQAHARGVHAFQLDPMEKACLPIVGHSKLLLPATLKISPRPLPGISSACRRRRVYDELDRNSDPHTTTIQSYPSMNVFLAQGETDTVISRNGNETSRLPPHQQNSRFRFAPC